MRNKYTRKGMEAPSTQTKRLYLSLGLWYDYAQNSLEPLLLLIEMQQCTQIEVFSSEGKVIVSYKSNQKDPENKCTLFYASKLQLN